MGTTFIWLFEKALQFNQAPNRVLSFVFSYDKRLDSLIRPWAFLCKPDTSLFGLLDTYLHEAALPVSHQRSCWVLVLLGAAALSGTQSARVYWTDVLQNDLKLFRAGLC